MFLHQKGNRTCHKLLNLDQLLIVHKSQKMLEYFLTEQLTNRDMLSTTKLQSLQDNSNTRKCSMDERALKYEITKT